MKSIRCKVLVVGGGPAGATAARDLGRKGIDTVLLEKHLTFEKPCGGGLMLSAFDEFEIPLSVIKKRVEQITLVSPKLQKVTVDIASRPLTIVHRCEFDATLRALAVKSGVRLVEAKAYDIDTENMPTVWAKHGEKRYKIEADHIIAADGVNSTLRKKLLQETPSRILTYYADIPGKESESCQFWFGEKIAPKEYAWIFPHHDGVNIGLAANNEKNIKSYFKNFTDIHGIGRVEKPKGYYIPKWGREVYYEKKVFFTGDSASMVLPFTYEGIYYAMKTGQLAAEAIVRKDPSSYQRQWENLYSKRFRFFRLMQSIFLSGDYGSELMVKLYRNPTFQRSVLDYWTGRREPLGFFRTIGKCFVVCLYRRLK